MKKYLSLFMVLAFVFSFSSARAEENGATSGKRPILDALKAKRAEFRDEAKTQRGDFKADIKDKREDFRDEAKTQRGDFKADIKDKREDFRGEVKTLRGDFKADFEAKKAQFREATPAEREALKVEIKTEREAFKSQLEIKREAFKKEVELKKAEFKDAKIEKRAEFRGKAQNMVGQNFEVAVRNLERSQNRVEEVIGRLNVAGRDTAAATESLNLSKQKLEAAKVKIAGLKALVPSTDEKVTAEVFSQIKLGAREAKDILKESHSALVGAIKLLKGLKTEASSTTGTEDEAENE